MQAEIKEKMDDYNKLLLEKEQNHREITARDKEIENLVAQVRELERRGAEVSKTVHDLEQQLQKMKKVETELKEVIFKCSFKWEWHYADSVFARLAMTVSQCCLRLCLAPSGELNCCVNGGHQSHVLNTGFMNCKPAYCRDGFLTVAMFAWITATLLSL